MRCILHIGPPRTGSTSIQRLLWGNRATLAEHGFFIPDGLGGQSQVAFAILADAEVLLNDRHDMLRIRTLDDLQRMQTRCRTELSGQIEAATVLHHTVVLSNEALSAKPRSVADSLKVWLGQYCDDFLVIACLRRQDLQRVSLLKNRVKNFSEPPEPFAAPPLDYAAQLGDWADIFGENAIRPIIFPDSALQPGDLIDSFMRASGLDAIEASSLVPPERRHNPQWDARAIELMALLNEFIPPGERKQRRIVSRMLNEAFPGEPAPFRPPRSEAEAYVALHAASNERVRARWFPGQSALFHSDFSMYPDKASGHLTTRDCAYMLAQFAARLAGRPPT